MTACVLNFAVPPERLGKDVSDYMQPDVGPTWPQEAHKVVLHDLKAELEGVQKADTPMKQLEARGFAVLKNRSNALGSLATQAEWNEAYLAETAEYALNNISEIYIWLTSVQNG